LAFCSRQFSQARLTRPLLVQLFGWADLGIGTLEFMDRSLMLTPEVPEGLSGKPAIVS
jgi:hypothetical protein